LSRRNFRVIGPYKKEKSGGGYNLYGLGKKEAPNSYSRLTRDPGYMANEARSARKRKRKIPGK
jgi:hypothetical protein